ncbi:MAG: hypothetical protein IRZ10_08540 [Thermoflavifilum sp.]|nr:hypothetical protein [Thermoflavifilum sp.]MCL6514459.1 hypothetical protein [Alicyclobacillus sp.]
MSTRRMALAGLWCVTALPVLFARLSAAGVIVRVPAMICLAIVVFLTITRRHAQSPWWRTAYLVGGALVLLSAVLVLTAKGTGAEAHVTGFVLRTGSTV